MSEDSPLGFAKSAHPSTIPGETLATYHWPCDSPDPIAAVFLVHGFRSHTRFNFLRSDPPNRLHCYGDDSSASSFIRQLNLRQITVHGHDHVGHGASSGLRAYFPSFQALVDDLVSYVKRVDEKLQYSRRGIPLFLVGHSLGGTVAIVAAREKPDLFQGMALSSAASEPPEGMFGVVGRIQAALSGVSSALVPTMELVALPGSPDVELQQLFDMDSLNCKNKLRARVGREFLNAYKDIKARVGDVRTPFLTVSGEMDTLVNPDAAQRFYEGASSEDKTNVKAQGRWHNLLVEKGREEMWELFGAWVEEKAKKVVGGKGG
eukprot:GFKZ01007292.1.p1 GENE.GFKZ01007292.1~~GFKZ01007292.1.p1  ORF type:complete len:366 (-),score=49.06 GFKZ01007292.1:371-1327(-)